MKKFAPWFAVLAFMSLAAFAQDNDAVSPDFLKTAHIIHANHAGGLHGKGNIPTPHGFPQGVDTLVNFTDHFEAQGVFYDGSAHHTWEYSMMGNAPKFGGTTMINAPVIPVSLDMRNADGSPRYVKLVDPQTGQTVDCSNPPGPGCQRLYFDVTPDIQPFMNGPVFGVANYSSSPVPTQFVDAVQRAEFGNHARADWHTLLAPSIKTPRVMTLTAGQYLFALKGDGTCCLFVLVNQGVFINNLFPSSTPDYSTVIGAAEVSGDITTKDYSTFLFPDTYLYDDLGNCCVLGFHEFDFEAGDASNGNRLRFYVMNYSSWITPGLFEGGLQDVTAHSHEVAESFNDPFVGFDGLHNVTPFWLNPAGQCQDIMEDGDVVEDLPNPTYPVTVNGVTYHPQTVALLPWFEFQTNSSAIDNAYSYPNETALTALSAPQPFACAGK